MPWLKPVDFRRLFKLVIFLWLGSNTLCLGQEASVLSSGTVFKIGITQTGVHKLDKSFLTSLGLDVSTLNPAHIRLFGNGGKMLAQRNADARPSGLTENAVWFKGGEDGRIDDVDALYFFGEGPEVISADLTTRELKHEINYYSDTSYYFIVIADVPAKRISASSTVKNEGKQVKEFSDYWYHEKESINTLKSGREWWGEYISGSSALTFQADLPGIVSGCAIKLRGSSMGNAQVLTYFKWLLNGQLLGEKEVPMVGTGTYDLKGIRSDVSFVTTASSALDNLTLGVSYDRKGQSSAQGYLNYIGVQVQRELNAYPTQQIYRFFPEVKDTVTYLFKSVPAEWLLWDISTTTNPMTIPLQGNTVNLTGGKSMRTWVGFNPSEAFVPAYWESVPHQNLQTIKDIPDLLIVTAPAWKNEAQRLANFRRDHDGLKALVVTTKEVYNDYSSGRVDMTAIRDFARKLFSQKKDGLKYLLLFGDATYDYKNNYQNQSKAMQQGWVPVYESRESLNPVMTYSSDDYYGFLKDADGEWPETVNGDLSMDIGVGRLPVKSLEEAKLVVDKLIRYTSSVKGYGNWRNSIRFVADDGDGNIHQRDADQLAKLSGSDFFTERIFLDEYPQITTEQGQKVQQVNDAIHRSVNQGTLILNYIGHGGTSGWAEEQVLTLSDMLTVRGLDNPPLLLTATCDFGRYDDPALVSGAELMLLSPKGGAIGAVGTTRPVYASSNFVLSQAFYNALLKKTGATRIGDIFKQTKNNALLGPYNRNFTLLGDPSMRLAAPEKKVRFSSIPDTLKALDKVQLNLEVVNAETGKIDSQFQGVSRIVVYDKQTTFRTLGNQDSPADYQEYRSKLFDGNVSTVNGKIQANFIVPKNIDYQLGLGRINVYAVSADSLSDAGGQLSVVVGGSAPMKEDKTPPKVTAWMNKNSFVSGDVIEPSSTLFAKISDESGINLSKTGIGQNILMTINDTATVILNDYYQADLDSYSSGTIIYPFEDLPVGLYTIRLKVWDIYNNSTEITFGFKVERQAGIRVENVKVFPNPFDNELSFELRHNRVNEDIEVIFKLYLPNGQLLGSRGWKYYYSEAVIKESALSPEFLSRLNRMILYIYSIEIKSLKDNSMDRHSGRIIRSP